MKSRGAVLAAAFLLAGVATVAIALYVHGVKQDSGSGPGVAVVVSKQDIPANTELNPLISSGAFKTVTTPKNQLVAGAVTSLTQLQNQTTSLPILAGEQISTARLRGANDVSGGALGIPKGYEAVTVPLDTSNAAGGGDVLQRGDHVTVYATLSNVGAAQIAATSAMVPDAEVLKVTQGADQWLVTIAVHPIDGQRMVYAQTQGTVWLALLPPNQKGVPTAPVTAIQVVK